LDEFRALADDVAEWLSRKVGVSSVQPPVIPRKQAVRARTPFHRRAPSTPSFEITFTFKGRARHFRYFIETVDDLAVMKSTLRVHTNGELLVTVPDGPLQVMPNDIHYGSRSVEASAFGEPAPRS